jgi:hypothetical protein
MVINSIVCFADLDGIDERCCLEVIARFLELDGIDDHCCLEVIVRFVDLGGIDYIPPRSTNRTITSKPQC